MRTHIALPLAAFGALLPAACSAPSVTLTPRIGEIEIDGDLRAIDTSGGPVIDASTDVDDLGLDDETVFLPRADLDWGPMRLTVDVAQLDYEGEGTITGDIILDGVTIPAGDDVATDLALDFGSATLTWDVVPTDLVDLGLGFGVVVARVDADITSQTSGDTASTDETAPIPVLAARAGVNFWRISVEGIARGMAVDFDDVDARFLEYDLAASVALVRSSTLDALLTLGYRAWDLDVEYEDDDSEVDLDLGFDGPYAGISIRF